MGQDKALVTFNNQPMIRQVLSRFTSLAVETFFTTNHPENFEFLGLRLVADIIPGRGAIGGLYTALSFANTPLVGVIACDMPFANPDILDFECKLVKGEGFDAAIPITGSGKEPFHAVYNKDICLPAIEESLFEGFLRVDSWFHKVRVRYIREEEIALLDPDGLAFWNVNTPEDLKLAHSLIE